MEYLVIGASGYIGSKIYQTLVKERSSETVIGTACTKKSADLLHFDLKTDQLPSYIPVSKEEKKVAIICSARSKIDYCKEHFEEAYELNVRKTKSLIEDLVRLHYKVVFLSSDQVFSGETGNYTETCNPDPINRYGQMKVEIEEYLLGYVKNACIMRIGKIVGARDCPNNVFTEWKNKLEREEPIFCIRDNIISFTDVEDVANAFLLVAENDLKGVYHTVSGDIMSRVSLANKFVKKMGKTANIQEKNVNDFGFLERRPLKTYLNHQKFVRETGYQFRNMDEVIEEFLANTKVEQEMDNGKNCDKGRI